MQDNRLIVQAVGTSPVWPQLLRDENVVAGFDLALQDDPYQPTDVASFNAVNIPTLNFFTGAHADYHRPSDTADKINYGDLDRIATFHSRWPARRGSRCTACIRQSGTARGATHEPERHTRIHRHHS